MIEKIKFFILSFFYNIKQLFDPAIYAYWYRHDVKNRIENFGDMLGPQLVCELGNVSLKHINDFQPAKYQKYIRTYFTVGSIISKTNKNSVVWGSGISDSRKKIPEGVKFLAVRGPLTRQKILDSGMKCPAVYGDPAILLPLLHERNSLKSEKITIIPHLVDYQFAKDITDPVFDVVNLLTNDFSKTLQEIISSNMILSSSLHGLIIAIVYKIPCIWVEFSNKIYGDGIKFYDFFESLEIKSVEKLKISSKEDLQNAAVNNKAVIVCDDKILVNLQKQLLESFPFKKDNRKFAEIISKL